MVNFKMTRDLDLKKSCPLREPDRYFSCSKLDDAKYSFITLRKAIPSKTKKAAKECSLTALGCRRGDSNPYTRRHTHLKRARLPISPLRHVSLVPAINGGKKRKPDWKVRFSADKNCSTEGGNRTRTLLPILDFESSASTNSATSA